jgi:dihydroorotate dehydrogenase
MLHLHVEQEPKMIAPICNICNDQERAIHFPIAQPWNFIVETSMSSLSQKLSALSYPVLRPLLFSLDAETAHHVTLAGLRLAERMGIISGAPPEVNPVTLWGLKFPNRVGLAAGLDKAGDAVDGFGALGFGFVEVGTLTPRPQPGNPLPRLFRVISKEAIVNRMGFNNPGIEAGMKNVAGRKYKGVLGVNIGKNFDTPNERATDDYLLGLRGAYAQADYVTVNLSSPNTKGLRDLQEEASCRALIRALHEEQRTLAQTHQKHVPILIKIAPDLEPQHLQALAKLFIEEKLEGVIATNTTLSRTYVEGLPNGDERGGLSGAPLTERATALIAELARALDGALPIIGVGGIMSGKDALDKMQAGATLVQIYSGLVYHGPALVQECIEGTGHGTSS